MPEMRRQVALATPFEVKWDWRLWTRPMMGQGLNLSFKCLLASGVGDQMFDMEMGRQMTEI